MKTPPTCPCHGLPFSLRYEIGHKRFLRPDGCPTWEREATTLWDAFGPLRGRATEIDRIAGHAAIDMLCRGAGAVMHRAAAYQWLAQVLGVEPDRAHVSKLTPGEIERLTEAAYAKRDELRRAQPRRQKRAA